jgi:SAM-dependent methyltransferase
VLGRLRRSVARHGLLGTAVVALKALGQLPRYGLNALDERRFDRRYGVDTRGLVRHGEGGAFHDGIHYQGTSPRLFREILAQVPAPPPSLTFVDIGCGKGRTLLLAAELGFRHVVGVELSEELARTARDNIRALGVDGEVQVVDAARMRFPDEPLLVYLYNPFGEATLKAVLENLRDSLRARPREVFVAYLNPSDGTQRPLVGHLMDADDFVAVASGRDWVVARAAVPSR